MTILFRSSDDDLFASTAQAWVNPVNCAGVMGKGLALVFRQRFPDNLRLYQQACSARTLVPGGILAVALQSPGPSYIVNLATKDHWRDPSQLKWVVQGAKHIVKWAQTAGIDSVACPALGAGEGQLPWRLVKPALQGVFEKTDIQFELYEPRALVKDLLLETLSKVAAKVDLSPTPANASSRRVRFRSR